MTEARWEELRKSAEKKLGELGPCHRVQLRRDELEELLKLAGRWEGSGQPPQEAKKIAGAGGELRRAATEAYNTLVDAMETLIACDHISMIRHPQLVDRLHRSVNGLKRTVQVCEPAGKATA